MRKFDQVRSRQVMTPLCGSFHLRALFCGPAFGAVLTGSGSTANATNYNEAILGDLSDYSGSPTSLGVPTSIGALTSGDNYIVGSSIPSGTPIPDGHGALTNQDNDFFTFTVPTGGVLSQFDLENDSSIVSGDRFFLGIYGGTTAPVDPMKPTPVGLLGYTLPGTDQLGKDLLPALAASNEPGFPSLPQHFSGDLGAGAYTVWLVDGDRSLSYDLDLVISSAPEPGAWVLMLAGVGLTGAMLRQRRPGTTPAVAA